MLQQAIIETCWPTLPEAQPSPVKHGTVCAQPANVSRAIIQNVYHCSRLIATYTLPETAG